MLSNQTKKVQIEPGSDDNLSSPDTFEDEELKHIVQPTAAKASRKRSYVDKSGDNEIAEQELNSDFGNEMTKMLEMFGADINKSLYAKRKRLEQYTAGKMLILHQDAAELNGAYYKIISINYSLA